MGKDLNGQELGKGLTQRKDGRYCGRAQICGEPIVLYGWNLSKLKQDLKREINRVKMAQIEPEYTGEEITLNEWFDIWYENYKKPFIKETCWKSYRRRFDNYFGKLIGDKFLKDILQIHIQAAVVDLKTAGRSAKSIKEALGMLRMCIDVAVANKLMTENPVIGVIMQDKTSVKKRVLTCSEQKLFLEYIEETNNWYKEMYQLLLVTGLRIGECGGLQDECIDFTNRNIYVRCTLYCEYIDGVRTIKLVDPKSPSSVRRIPFFGETEDILRRQLNKRDKLKKNLGTRWRMPEELGNLIFVTSMGSPVTRYIAEDRLNVISKSMSQIFIQRAVKEGRIPDDFEPITPHSLRHTFCTRLFEKGMKAEVVQKIMGHANYSTTLEYTHILKDVLQEEAGKIGNFFS